MAAGQTSASTPVRPGGWFLGLFLGGSRWSGIRGLGSLGKPLKAVPAGLSPTSWQTVLFAAQRPCAADSGALASVLPLVLMLGAGGLVLLAERGRRRGAALRV